MLGFCQRDVVLKDFILTVPVFVIPILRKLLEYESLYQ